MLAEVGSWGCEPTSPRGLEGGMAQHGEPSSVYRSTYLPCPHSVRWRHHTACFQECGFGARPVLPDRHFWDHTVQWHWSLMLSFFFFFFCLSPLEKLCEGINPCSGTEAQVSSARLTTAYKSKAEGGVIHYHARGSAHCLRT